MKSTMLAASLLALSSVAALGDEPFSSPMADWQGFYAGGHAGFAWMDTDGFAVTPSCPSGCPDTERDSVNSSGAIFGGQVGYNTFLHDLLVGVEADGSFFTGDSVDLALKDTFAVDYDWFATVRGRAGVVHDRVLFYATGGLALTEIETGLLGSSVLPGITVGAGFEYMFAPGWSLKAEYLYLDFLSKDGVTNTPATSGFTTNTSLDPSGHMVRGGISFHF